MDGEVWTDVPEVSSAASSYAMTDISCSEVFEEESKERDTSRAAAGSHFIRKSFYVSDVTVSGILGTRGKITVLMEGEGAGSSIDQVPRLHL